MNYISCSNAQLLIILYKLINTSIGAMPDGGRLLISTENQNIEKSLTGYEMIPPGEYVMLSVSDTGVGIAEEDLPEIFEPSYAKIHQGRSGSDTGLAIVMKVVKDNAGFIDVKSEVNSGTTYRIYFPVTKN